MGNVKERGILLSPPMVLAILAGEKRQTRRTLKLPSWVKDTERAVFLLNEMAAAGKCAGLAEYDNGLSVRRFTCPCGQSGDRLWVREAYALLADPGSTRSWDGLIPEERPTPDRTQLGHIPTPIYRCDGERPDVTSQLGRKLRWRPGIHMPRWASRILLEVKAVRVERLWDISESDAQAEGVSLDGGKFNGRDVTARSYRGAFANLWSHINGERSWAANPWVWVVEFERTEVQRGQ